MIKALILDLDNTLYSYDLCNEEGKSAVISEVSKRYGLDKDFVAEEYKLSRMEVKSRLAGTASEHSRFLYIQKLIESITGKTDVNYVMHLNDLFWKEYLEKMLLHQSTIDFLAYLKERGVKIILATNLTAEIQFRKLSQLKIEYFFDYIVTSEEAGAEKPDIKVFNLCFKKAKVDPSECIMIGDDAADQEGARRAGIKFVRVTGPEDLSINLLSGLMR